MVKIKFTNNKFLATGFVRLPIFFKSSMFSYGLLEETSKKPSALPDLADGQAVPSEVRQHQSFGEMV